MKGVRFVLTGAALFAICCLWAAHGNAQIGGSMQDTAKRKKAVVVGPPTIGRTPGPAEQKMLSSLKEPVDFEFTETPLNEVLTYIKDNHDLQIFVDNRVLSDAGIDTSTLPITTNLKGISLRSALNSMLQSQGLAWYFADELLKITTKDNADGIFETRLYDVGDLISNDRDPQAPPDFDSLINTIVATVKGNWREVGGLATIHPFGSGGIRAIAVAQTYDGHEQIESLLAELRKMKPQR